MEFLSQYTFIQHRKVTFYQNNNDVAHYCISTTTNGHEAASVLRISIRKLALYPRFDTFHILRNLIVDKCE